MPAAVVEYKGWKEGYSCGYCGATQGKVSAGERGWAELAGPGRSAGLLGWRRPRRAARAKHGGTAASCARRPRAARTKDGGGRRFRVARSADLRRAGMAAGGGSPSIVEFFGGEDGYRCGYCRSDTGNLSHGAGGAGCERHRGRAARGWPRSGGCGRGAGEAAGTGGGSAAAPARTAGSSERLLWPGAPNECDRT